MKKKYASVLSLMFSAIFAVNTMAQGSLMTPARQTLENLGFTSSWDAETKTAVFKNNEYIVSVTAGSDCFEVNGEKIYFKNSEKGGTLYNSPVIIDGSFYLPDEELAQAIGAEVIEDTIAYVMPDDKAVSLDLNTQKLSDIEGITNARQLGGYVNTEGRKIKDNVMLRTGAPADGTESDLKLLSEKYHVSDIIDFRTDYEAQTKPEPTVDGAKYHHIPLNVAGNMAALVTDDVKKEIAAAQDDKGKLLMLYSKLNVLPTPEMYKYFLSDEPAEG